MRCLVESYPGALCDATATELVWCDGTRMTYRGTQTSATHGERLDHADLADQMSQAYAPFQPARARPLDHDPGRLRHSPFFDKLYGGDRATVARRTVAVRWLDGQVVRVHTAFGIDRKLAAVRDELARLPAAVATPARTTAGTFVWRNIAGTERRSAHGWAIAIDVGVATSDYWRWQKSGDRAAPPFRNRMPRAVVDAFERHGFIWGGRWHHFDTMHFEYRPELLHRLCVARAQGGASANGSQIR